MSAVMNAHETPQQAARRLFRREIVQGYQPEALHAYRAADGAELFFRARLRKPDGGKFIRPFYKDENGTFRMGEPTFDGLKLLYNLRGLESADSVFVVEGEKCVDALAKVGVVAVTSGSSSSAAGADWSPLKGRDAVIWPDADAAGAKYAEAVAQKLREMGAASIRIIDVRPLGLAEHGDCVDWLKANPRATADDVRKLAAVEAGASPGDERRAVTRRLADVQPERLSWLWPNRIPIGKLTMLAGDPGLGKSLVTAAIATNVTLGGVWPVDGGRCAPGSVIFLSAEDDPADTLRPRLEAAEAAIERVHVLEAVRKVSGDGRPIEGSFDLAADLDALEDEVRRLGDVRLVVIDPISAYLGGAVDSHNNSDVRGLLAPLARLAQRHRLAVLMVSHLNKGQGPAAYRVTGSLAFTAAARASHLVVKDKDDPKRRLVISQKANLAPDSLALAYRVGTVETEWGPQPVIEWERFGVEISAEEALTNKPGPDADDRSDVEQWLRNELRNKPREAKEMLEIATQGKGYSKRTVERARKAIGVVSYRPKIPGPWWWRLPDAQDRHSSQDRHPSPRGGYLGDLGGLVENQQVKTPPDTQHRQDRQVPWGRGDVATLENDAEEF